MLQKHAFLVFSDRNGFVLTFLFCHANLSLLTCPHHCLIYLDFQGEWILSGKDACNNSKLLHLYMYAVKCENLGHSKDPFLTQVSNFAVLFGNELDAEVLIPICATASSSFSVISSFTPSDCIHFIGVIDVNGSIYRSNCDYKVISCL